MLTPPGEIVRRHDPDRFLTALFAPLAKRDALFVLYAFNHELARAREVTDEPHIALMRLQWWRDVVEGTVRKHEVAEPLSDAIASGQLDRDDLLGVIDAREIEAEPCIETVQMWRDYLLGAGGGLAVAAGRLLQAPDPEQLRPLGAAYAAGRLLRSTALLAARRRCLLPADRLAAHGLSPEAVTLGRDLNALDPILDELAEIGREFLLLGRSASLPRKAIAAALPAVLAPRDLRWVHRPPRARGLGERLAVMLAAMRGRAI